ncbi:MAG: DUF697 domain-containing protein [Methylococcaceae bacterium]|nr:MAG: DUF697 domain-containing protein [Methylococcaceae bacterium]
MNTETHADLQKRTQKGNAIIKNYVIANMAVSLVPFPLVDLVVITGIQLKMLHSLAKLWDVPFKKDVGKSILAALVGSGVPTGAAMTAASAAKTIPMGGTAAGIISLSLLSGAATYAIGKVFTQHFASGGTFLDFDPDSVREHFNSLLAEGKQVVTDLKKESPKEAPAPAK